MDWTSCGLGLALACFEYRTRFRQSKRGLLRARAGHPLFTVGRRLLPARHADNPIRQAIVDNRVPTINEQIADTVADCYLMEAVFMDDRSLLNKHAQQALEIQRQMKETVIIAGTFEKTAEGGWLFTTSGRTWRLPAGAVPRFSAFVNDVRRAEVAATAVKSKSARRKPKAAG